MIFKNSIQEAVVLGKVGSISTLVHDLLDRGISAQSILDQHLLPGMAIVGEHFKQNVMFLPQVLMSAQVMQTAIDIIKPRLLGEGSEVRQQTIIIGTVKGDMHDIGKNLVRIMLVGAGFEVIDLGVNIPASRFIETCEVHPGSVVCLSALLSSTMNNMEEIVGKFRKHSELKLTRILIGGAPVSREFASSIGADAYAPTATAAVEQVSRWFSDSPLD